MLFPVLLNIIDKNLWFLFFFTIDIFSQDQ